MGAYDTPTTKCPYCGIECEADWVDVGVGMVQCGPYYCTNCGASEIGCHDNLKFDRQLWRNAVLEEKTDEFIVPEGARVTKEELLIGWYGPGRPLSNLANTFQGTLVDHETAHELYRLGLLDEKDTSDCYNNQTIEDHFDEDVEPF